MVLPPEDVSALALLAYENRSKGGASKAVRKAIGSKSARRVGRALEGRQGGSRDVTETAKYIKEWASRTP